jgi:hypothetical protein
MTMPFRVTYQVNVDFVGAGLGPMGNGLAPSLPQGGRGGAQTLEFSNALGGQNSNTFLAADITNLTNAMAADIAAQMTANIARIQAFSTGGG